MKRSLLTLLSVAIAAIGLFLGTAWIAARLCAHQMATKGDDLEWLRQEFHLQPAELLRIRQLHEGYLPRCRELCAQIELKKQEIEALLAGRSSFDPAVESKLTEIAQLRARCQTQMLQHFFAVSQAMPPTEGRRYLAEMQRLTLGSHEQFERTMSTQGEHIHGP